MKNMDEIRMYLLHLLKLNSINTIESEFKNGDFGNLKRVEFENDNRMGNVDFWSNGYMFYNLINPNLNEDYILIDETLFDVNENGVSQAKVNMEMLVEKILT